MQISELKSLGEAENKKKAKSSRRKSSSNFCIFSLQPRSSSGSSALPTHCVTTLGLEMEQAGLQTSPREKIKPEITTLDDEDGGVFRQCEQSVVLRRSSAAPEPSRLSLRSRSAHRGRVPPHKASGDFSKVPDATRLSVGFVLRRIPCRIPAALLPISSPAAPWWEGGDTRLPVPSDAAPPPLGGTDGVGS